MTKTVSIPHRAALTSVTAEGRTAPHRAALLPRWPMRPMRTQAAWHNVTTKPPFPSNFAPALGARRPSICPRARSLSLSLSLSLLSLAGGQALRVRGRRRQAVGGPRASNRASRPSAVLRSYVSSCSSSSCSSAAASSSSLAPGSTMAGLGTGAPPLLASWAEPPPSLSGSGSDPRRAVISSRTSERARCSAASASATAAASCCASRSRRSARAAASCCASRLARKPRAPAPPNGHTTSLPPRVLSLCACVHGRQRLQERARPCIIAPLTHPRSRLWRPFLAVACRSPLASRAAPSRPRASAWSARAPAAPATVGPRRSPAPACDHAQRAGRGVGSCEGSVHGGVHISTSSSITHRSDARRGCEPSGEAGAEERYARLAGCPGKAHSAAACPAPRCACGGAAARAWTPDLRAAQRAAEVDRAARTQRRR
jgi:hypothetical protein